MVNELLEERIFPYVTGAIPETDGAFDRNLVCPTAKLRDFPRGWVKQRNR